MIEPRGIRNHNPGNIRHGSKWQGLAAEQTDPEFCRFIDPVWGIRAICRLLLAYQSARRARDGSRIDTVQEFIERWAPASENYTNAYAAHVRKQMGLNAGTVIDVSQWYVMRGLVTAIIRHENGKQPYDVATIEDAMGMAGLRKDQSSNTGSSEQLTS